MFRTGGLPSFAKEGWLRHKENSPVPLSAQTGWLFKPPIIKKRARSISGNLKQPPRPLLSKDASPHSSLCRVHPSFVKEGISPRFKSIRWSALGKGLAHTSSYLRTTALSRKECYCTPVP